MSSIMASVTMKNRFGHNVAILRQRYEWPRAPLFAHLQLLHFNIADTPHCLVALKATRFLRFWTDRPAMILQIMASLKHWPPRAQRLPLWPLSFVWINCLSISSRGPLITRDAIVHSNCRSSLQLYSICTVIYDTCQGVVGTKCKMFILWFINEISG